MATTETVEVPADTLAQLLLTHARGKSKYCVSKADPNVEEALTAFAANTGTITISADSAYWLAGYANALTVYELDAGDEDTYKHPAVLAELDVLELVEEQAPEACARLDAQAEAELAEQAAEDEATQGSAAEESATA